MGSIVISDVVSDVGRFPHGPHTMMVGDVHQGASSTSESSHASSMRPYASHTPMPAYGHQQRHQSSAATPTQASTLASATGRPASTKSYHSFASDRTSSQTSSTTSQPFSSQQTNASSQSFAANNAAVAYNSKPASTLQSAPNAAHTADGFDQSGFPLSQAPSGLASSPPSPRLLPTMRSSLSLNNSNAGSPARIKVRDLTHIQSFASEEVLTRSRQGSRRTLKSRQDGTGQQYEISSMPVTDIIEMVAGRLTKITNTNDRQHENVQRPIPPPEGTAGLSPQSASIIAFHGKNVPSISILSYLSRIHKYCPTTYEVFLSLLVYFDRMTEMINSGALQGFCVSDNVINNGKMPRNAEDEKYHIVEESGGPNTPFVVDSFNIHRLVIAGVTVASKFFSDVFYTNSRYAKVSPSSPQPSFPLFARPISIRAKK